MINHEKEHYEQFINEILKNRELWLLKEGDNILVAGNEDETFMPVWSREKLAKRQIKDEWINGSTEKIFLCDFIEMAEQELINEGIKALIDIDDEPYGIKISFADLIEELKQGAEKIGFDWRELSAEQQEFIKAYKNADDIIRQIVENRELWISVDDEGIVCIEDENGRWIPVWISEDALNNSEAPRPENSFADAINLGDFINLCIYEADESAEDNENHMQGGICLCDENGYIRIDFENLIEVIKEKSDEMDISFEELLSQDLNQMRFIFNVVKNGEVWVVGNENGISVIENDMEESIPMFASHDEAYAECKNEWSGCEAIALTTSELVEELLPNMEKDGITACLIVRRETGNFLAPNELREEILEEIRKQNPKSSLLRRTSSLHRGDSDGEFKKIFS